MEQHTRRPRRQRKKNNQKKFTYKMQANLVLVFCVILAAMIGLMGQIFYLTRGKGEQYESKALSQQSYVSSVIPYKRGTILDRNGLTLARSEKVYNVILDPKVLLTNENNVEVTLQALSEIFELDKMELETRLQEKAESSYVILKKRQPYELMSAFEERSEEQKKASRVNRIAGVWFEEEYLRKYPYGSLASHLLGYTNSGNVGSWGVEQYYNTTLNGTNGRVYGYYDNELNLVRTVKAPQNGNTLITTIDANIQGKVEEHVANFIDTVGCENIGVILMDPNTGGIISMVSNKGFDLNDPRDLTRYYSEEEIAAMDDETQLKALNRMWRNFCISDTYEPGSTFKPFTVAAALEEDLVKPSSTFLCTGVRMVAGWPITCNNKGGHGYVTLAEALMKSCNPALMAIGELEGREVFWNYQDHFGFGKKTGIDLPGEERGILNSVEKLNITELLTSSFGQTFNVTMIQLVSAYCSLVNGGYYYQPHVVQEIINENGATVESKESLLVKETVSASTSEFIREAGYLTVEKGTATPAKVEGYLIGGKTGTAQKGIRSQKKYVVSFIGSVPADDPELVIFVAIDEVHDEEKKASSSLATKLTSEILSDILPSLSIFPEGEIDYKIELPQVKEDNTNDDNNTPLGENGTPVPTYDPSQDESNPDAIPDDMPTSNPVNNPSHTPAPANPSDTPAAN